MPKTKKKIELSLTDFVDFVCKSGSTKLTKVKQIKNREDYSPATDFYKALREGIQEIHRNNGKKKELKSILDSVSDSKKIKNYTESIEGYKKFWGRKDPVWFEPPMKHWIVSELDVRINPELGLEIDGKKYLIKLYFKSDKLSKEKVTQVLTLMESELRNEVDSDVNMAILDVKNGKLFIKEDRDLTLLPLLKGEAMSFEIMWDDL
jgi:hypothetical protein